MPYAMWDNGYGDMEIAIHDRNIDFRFNDIVKPRFEKIQMSFFKNQRLRELRDSLLLKLMSGELEVSEFDM
jgi:type I restriction enzyme S subunit